MKGKFELLPTDTTTQATSLGITEVRGSLDERNFNWEGDSEGLAVTLKMEEEITRPLGDELNVKGSIFVVLGGNVETLWVRSTSLGREREGWGE